MLLIRQMSVIRAKERRSAITIADVKACMSLPCFIAWSYDSLHSITFNLTHILNLFKSFLKKNPKKNPSKIPFSAERSHRTFLLLLLAYKGKIILLFILTPLKIHKQQSILCPGTGNDLMGKIHTGSPDAEFLPEEYRKAAWKRYGNRNNNRW